MTAATPKTGTRAWFAILAAHDIADSLRRLRLPCAARLSLPTATPQDWDDIGTELAALAIDELREHERRHRPARSARLVPRTGDRARVVGQTLETEGVGESSGRVDGHHHRAATLLRGVHRDQRGGGGLADPPGSAAHDDRCPVDHLGERAWRHGVPDGGEADTDGDIGS